MSLALHCWRRRSRLLLVSQLSFDIHDLPFYRTPHNEPLHNWGYKAGAYLAWLTFIPLGVAAYLLPLALAAFGVAYLLGLFIFLRERLRWMLLWTVMFFVSVTGLAYLVDDMGWVGKWHESLGVPSIGGFLGYFSYGQTANWQFGFSLLGRPGATIIYLALGLISLLFLTNFQLGHWIRAMFSKADAEDAPKSGEEAALEKRARDLEKQKRKLEEEVGRFEKPEKIEKHGLGLGADGLQRCPSRWCATCQAAAGRRVHECAKPLCPNRPRKQRQNHRPIRWNQLR